MEVARELDVLDGVDIVGVAGRHRYGPTKGFEPTIHMASLPIGGPLLFESWLRLKWPLVESVVDDADLVHSTTIIAPATRLPLVVTIHDLAFLRHPDFFTPRGNKVFRRSLDIVREKAAMVLCSSEATLNDCVSAGFEINRLRHVPLGVTTHAISDADRARVRETYNLPEEFILFVGTLEPRKNLARLIEALETLSEAPPLVIVGMTGWGDSLASTTHDVRFTGFVPAADLPALYEAARVFAFPSVLEGYGLPVIEAMAHGAPVVTSRGTSTEEVARGAAVLVDPLDVSSIASGIREALDNYESLHVAGLRRAADATWAHTARATVEAYETVLRGAR